MATGSPNIRGEQRRIYAVRKTAYSTAFPTFANSNALRCLDFKMGLKRPRENRMDNRQALGPYERITKLPEGTFQLETYLQGSGALGSAWSISPLLFALLGAEAINAGVNVTYSLSASQSALGWFDLMYEANQVASEVALNAWIGQGKIAVKGKEEAKISFQGGFSNDIFTGSTALTGAAANGAANLVIAAGEEEKFDRTLAPQLGSRVSVGTSTGPHEVTARASGQITVSPVIVGAQSIGDIIRPYHPGEVAPPDVIAGILGNIQIGGTTYRIQEFELNINNNLEPHDDEAFLQNVEDYDRGWRDVMGFIKFRARRDQIRYMRQRKDFPNIPINVDFGATAGRIMEVDIQRAEFEFEALEVPSKGQAVVTLPFVAKPSAHDQNDECTVILR
jgi:hypothetical protein